MTPSEKKNHDQNEINASTTDPTDDRLQYDYKSKYPQDALKEINWEAGYLLFILFSSLLVLFTSWADILSSGGDFTSTQAITIKKYGYYASAGMLGGVTFGIKYLYRVVARGFWHQDRRLWRILSPFVAMVVGLMTGALFEANLTHEKPDVFNGATMVMIGFLAGYFADEAVGKMYEVANVIFGKSSTPKKD